MSAPSLSRPWHGEHVMDEWAMFLDGHQFWCLQGPGCGLCLGCGEQEECGRSGPQAAHSGSATSLEECRPIFLKEPGMCIADEVLEPR